MEIRLRLFAGLRQVAGFKEKVVTLPEGAVVADVLEQLPSSIVGRTFYIAVNEEYARRDSVLKDGDLLALLPPVSGGVHFTIHNQAAAAHPPEWVRKTTTLG